VLLRAVRLLCCCLLPAVLTAQEPGPQGMLPDEASAALDAFKGGDHSPEQLARLLPHLGATGLRERLRQSIAALPAFPRSSFAALLSHPQLAVRMGALEFLEEVSGGDFGYSPWVPPEAPENAAPLARWKAWAGESGPVSSAGVLTADQRQSCLREILGGDPDKSARSRRMLESDGLRSLEFLEAFLAGSPALPEAARIRIREAEYQIVLARRFGPQAESLARDLSTGSRDQLLSALVSIRAAGMEVLPILRDFLPHADPLVRETAIDSFLSTGREAALTVATPILAEEKDINVIHGALRRLKDIPGQPALDLARHFLTHADEDLLVSALQTCQQLSGGNERYYGNRKPEPVPAELQNAVLALLSDPRWRVRTVALEFVTALRLDRAGDMVVRLLDDPDNFVRFAAIKAAGAIVLKSAQPALRRLFFADEAMIGPVIDGYGALSLDLDDEMMARLQKASVDVRIGALRAMEAHSSNFLGEALTFAGDSDPDVACTALRFLAADDDRLKDENVQKAVLAAVNGANPARAAAVFDNIYLPRNERRQSVGVKRSADSPTALDPLYDAFLVPLTKSLEASGGEPGVANPVVAAAIRIARDSASPLAWPAAAALADHGWPQAWAPLVRMLPNLKTAQKVQVADVSESPSGPDSVTFYSALLADPVQEVREAAASTLLDHGREVPAFVSLVLPALTSGPAISPASLLGYRLNETLRSPAVRKEVQPWALDRLKDAAAAGSLRIFAALVLELAPDPGAVPTLTDLARSGGTVWLRRAAWHALAFQQPDGIVSHLETLRNDPDVPVRLVVPDVYSRAYSRWAYQFDDLQVATKQWYEPVSQKELPPAALAALEAMAARDPSLLVRFEAQFALLTHHRPVDLDQFLTLLARQPAESGARWRLTDWLDSAADTAGPGLRPLLAIVDHGRISADNYRKLVSRIGAGSAGFQTFGDLVKDAQAASLPQHTAPAPGGAAAPARTSLPVIYFHKPGCEECRRARELLTSLRAPFPLLTVIEHNIMEASSTLLNQALCARFSVPAAQHSVTPALFAQGGYAVRGGITPESVGSLLQRTSALAQDDSWQVLSSGESEAARAEVDRRYASLTLSVVILAGLLDGINPCAFATIILFLSWLQVARRTPREMLLTGAAFILAVFIAYLSAGLVLFQVLAGLSRFTWIQRWMNFVFAAFALLAAFLSFRDGWRAGRGRMDEMTLQLPGFLKNRIRSAIRTGAKARRFIISAFVTGLIVSLLELACTGQVYAPIVYQIQQGRAGAVAWLVLYNLAFILPLTVIFLLTWAGLRSEHLVAFQKKHTRAVKFALGLLFCTLAALILFGEQFLH
jgi:cytochrome c biogenesis protein CcdA/HEAT repeat protein